MQVCKSIMRWLRNSIEVNCGPKQLPSTWNGKTDDSVRAVAWNLYSAELWENFNCKDGRPCCRRERVLAARSLWPGELSKQGWWLHLSLWRWLRFWPGSDVVPRYVWSLCSLFWNVMVVKFRFVLKFDFIMHVTFDPTLLLLPSKFLGFPLQ